MKKSIAISLLFLFLSVIGVKSWHALNHNHDKIENLCDSHEHNHDAYVLSQIHESLTCLICDFQFTSFDLENVNLFFQDNIFVISYLDNYINIAYHTCSYVNVFLRGPPSIS